MYAPCRHMYTRERHFIFCTPRHSVRFIGQKQQYNTDRKHGRKKIKKKLFFLLTNGNSRVNIKKQSVIAQQIY